jgi:hypothetical protein
MIGDMKKCFVVALAFLIFVLLFSCDRYSGKRPRDYPPAVWVSEKPKMWFEIGESDKSAYTPPERIYGNLIMNGQSIEIEVFFNGGRGISFYEKSDATDRPTTRGDCTFGPDKLVVKIDKDRDNFLNGLYETITFIRAPKWIFDAVTDIPTGDAR